MGVVKDGVLGIVETNGNPFFIEKDYVQFRYWCSDPMARSVATTLVTCTHKSGATVTFSKSDGSLKGFKKMRYIEATNKEGLKGYVYYGVLVTPQYTNVKVAYLPYANFECTLPNGEKEYYNGAELVSAEKIKAYNDAEAKKKKEEEEKAKKKRRKKQKNSKN